MSDCTRVLDYMKSHGHITTFEAFSEFGCTRLPSRIHDLRKAGYNIAKRTEYGVDRWGEKSHWAVYSLEVQA